MELSFFVGLGLGSVGLFVTMKTLQKQEIIKLKRNFSSQQEIYEDQLKLQAENHELTIANHEMQFPQRLESLEQQLHHQAEEKIKLLEKLEQEKEINIANQRKLKESNRDIDTILESLEQSQQEVIQLKDEEIALLKTQIEEYAIQLEQKNTELFALKEQANQAHFTATEISGDRLNAEQIQELITILFPDITLLRDSINILAAQPEHLVAMIKALKDIMEGQAYSAKKVRATDNKWTECRVPHINLMRLYYQKCKKHSGYQVLISPKKNQKSQDQDYEWLKSQGIC